MNQPRVNRAMTRLKLDENNMPVVDREPRLVITGTALAELRRLLRQRSELAGMKLHDKGEGEWLRHMVALEARISAWVHAQYDQQEAGLNDDTPM